MKYYTAEKDLKLDRSDALDITAQLLNKGVIKEDILVVVSDYDVEL